MQACRASPSARVPSVASRPARSRVSCSAGAPGASNGSAGDARKRLGCSGSASGGGGVGGGQQQRGGVPGATPSTAAEAEGLPRRWCAAACGLGSSRRASCWGREPGLPLLLFGANYGRSIRRRPVAATQTCVALFLCLLVACFAGTAALRTRCCGTSTATASWACSPSGEGRGGARVLAWQRALGAQQTPPLTPSSSSFSAAPQRRQDAQLLLLGDEPHADAVARVLHAGQPHPPGDLALFKLI